MRIETQQGYYGVEDAKVPIEVVAHSLGNLCRFTGHSSMFYSVADHSVLVSRLAEWLGGDPMEGLLHDAHECLMGDMASPWKFAFPEFRKIEKRLALELQAYHGVVPVFTDEVKQADMIALFLEASVFLPSRGEDWEGREKYERDIRQAHISGIVIPDSVFKAPHEGAIRFLERFQWLRRH